MLDTLLDLADAARERRDALQVFDAHERNEATVGAAYEALSSAAAALRRSARAIERCADDLIAKRARLVTGSAPIVPLDGRAVAKAVTDAMRNRGGTT
jgi:hypothetical protein